MHQFTKVEMFVITRVRKTPRTLHEAAARHRREGSSQALELPYRVIDVATGDLGAPAYRKFDIEAWIPGRGESRRLR